MAKRDITNLKESRNILREMEMEVERINKGMKDQDSLQSKLTRDAKSQVDAAIKLRDANELSARGLSDVVNLSKRVQENDIDIVESRRLQADLEAKAVDAMQKGNKKAEKAARIQIGILNSLDRRLETEEETKASLKKQEQIMSGMDDLTGGLASKAKDFGKALKSPIVGTFAVLGLIVGLFMAVAEHTDQIGEKFGAIGVNEFRGDLMGATATAQSLGFGFDEIAGSVSELSNNFGVAFGDAIKISEASMDTARALGISTDQAAQLTGQLMTIGGHSAQTAQDFLKQTAALAKSAGVAPGVVMEDIAGSSEEIASFTKDSGENIAHAAIKARSLGMNLGDVAKVADGLLDFQSSLSAEMEASVLIGKQLNFQRARELALAGDLSGMMDNVLSQLGSEEEFNRLNVIQRKALANSLGVGVDQMAKMVKHAGKSNLELARMGENIDISNIASKDAMSAISEMRFMFKSWGTEILTVLANLSQIGNGLGLLIPLFVVLGGWLAFTALKGAMSGLGMKLAGKGAAAGAKGMASFAAAGSAAIPLLLSVGVGAAGIGVAFFGIGAVMKQLPPVIDAVARGFKVVSEVVTASILKLATPEVVMGIMGLAGSFFMLAGALASVAVAGVAAIPAMTAVTAFTAAMTALNAVSGGGDAGDSQIDALKLQLETLNVSVSKLIENFDNNYIPKIVQSNIDGAKKSSREIGRQFQTNAG